MKKPTNTSRIYVLMAVVVLVVGMLLSGYAAFSSNNSQREFLEQRVAGLASALPRDVIDSLPGEEEDAQTENYLMLKKSLQDIATVNPDIRFIYVTKFRENSVYFLADSEPQGSEDESPPGQEYEEVDEEYKSAHTEKSTLVVGPTQDRWGTWISGVSSITDGDDEIIAVLGMDIPANQFIQNIITSALIVLVPTVLFASLLFILASRSRLRDKDIITRMNLLTSVADNVRTPLEGVRWASEQLASKDEVRNNPELNQLAVLLSASVTKVVDSVKDIVDATEDRHDTTNIELTDRVDVVALIIDIVDSLKLNALTKNVHILLGSSWPASYTIDTNEKEFSKAVTGILSRIVSSSQAQHSINIDYKIEDGRWNILIYDPSRTASDVVRLYEALAVQQLVIRQLGGELTIENDSILKISFSVQSRDIRR